MADITLQELKRKQDLMIHNPALMQREVLELFTDVMDGRNPAVDPTSPWMQLIEASVTSASAATDHSVVNLSKRYPVLAHSETDLYAHMSDEDYRSRFAVPATGKFTFIMPYDSLLQNVIQSDSGVYKYVSIPLDTQVVIDNIAYSLKHAIEIRLHRNSVIKVVYSLEDTVSTVPTNIINSAVLADNNGIKLLTFDIELTQLRKTIHKRPMVQSATFREVFEFTEGFHSIQLYYNGINNVGTWTK